MVHADKAAANYLRILRESRAFRIEPFDERAAFEVAVQIREDLKIMGKKRRASMAAVWGKVKFDHQIVAIAKVNGATIIYSDDEDVRKFGQASGLTVTGLAQLPLPPNEAQGKLDLKLPPDEPKGS